MLPAVEGVQSTASLARSCWLWLTDCARFERNVSIGATAGSWLALGLTLYFVLATWFLFLRSRGYIDYVEGLVLFHQTQAAAGENIYDAKFREAPMYSLPMYGPVYYYLLAPVVAFYPTLLPGRIVAMLSLLAMSGLSWHLLRKRFGATRLVASVAALPWLALYGPLYFGINNRVDSFSVCMGVAALFAVNSRRPRLWLLSIPLLLLAGFTRTTAAVAPGAAIVAVLLLERRLKEAITITAAVIGVASIIVLAGNAITGGNFSECLIYSNGSVPLKKAYWTVMTANVCKQALLPAGAIAALFLLRDRATRIFGLHTILSFLLAVATSAKIGSNVNYFIEPSWSAGLSLALLLATLTRPVLARVAAVATCVLLMQSAAGAEGKVRRFANEMKNFPGLMRLVETYGSKGPILTMESGAQVLAGQKVYMADLHIFTRLNEVGKFDLTPIENDLREHRLAAVIARDDVKPDFRGHSNWTPEMRQIVATCYEPVEQFAGLTAYVPRKTPSITEDRPCDGRHASLEIAVQR